MVAAVKDYCKMTGQSIGVLLHFGSIIKVSWRQFIHSARQFIRTVTGRKQRSVQCSGRQSVWLSFAGGSAVNISVWQTPYLTDRVGDHITVRKWLFNLGARATAACEGVSWMELGLHRRGGRDSGSLLVMGQCQASGALVCLAIQT